MQYVCPRSPRNAKKASIFCLLRAKSTLLDETTKKVHTECYFRIAFSWIQRVNSNKNWWRKGQISERIFLSPLARYYSHQLHPNTQWAEMKLAKTKKHIKTNKRASEKFCHTNGLHLMCVCVFFRVPIGLRARHYNTTVLCALALSPNQLACYLLFARLEVYIMFRHSVSNDFHVSTAWYVLNR